MQLHVTIHFIIIIESALYHNRHAEVHHFQKLQEELARKTEEVHVLEDHIADIYLEARAHPMHTEALQSQSGRASQESARGSHTRHLSLDLGMWTLSLNGG